MKTARFIKHKTISNEIGTIDQDIYQIAPMIKTGLDPMGSEYAMVSYSTIAENTVLFLCERDGTHLDILASWGGRQSSKTMLKKIGYNIL